jgi:hypothetical protein
MAARKGQPKTPGSGRKPGTPNKATQDMMARLAELGCDPIAGMACLALDESNPPELRGRMFAELASYTYPKRKAVEHTGPEGGNIVVHWLST